MSSFRERIGGPGITRAITEKDKYDEEYFRFMLSPEQHAAARKVLQTGGSQEAALVAARGLNEKKPT